jgi:long-chain fatty acid transport protein
MTRSRKFISLTPLCALLAAGSAYATNGMLMEGYGPIATGMGGASQATDHGNAAMAQNPATLAFMPDGASRLDLAFGLLGPDVRSSVPGMDAKSGGTSYAMPAVGYTKRNGPYTWGIGMFAQGGMGTEYEANSFLAMGSGSPVRSELGIGNLIFPLAYQVNPDVTVGAALKYMWSSLDMLMAASGAQLGGMVAGASGNLAGALGPLGGAPWARINFSDGNKFTGAASATGFGGSIGTTVRFSKDLVVGASYQFKSGLADMKTASSAASMTAFGGFSDNGQITVIDFQMPSVIGIGASWQARPSLLLAADLKYIGWADSMKNFSLRYDSAQMGGSVSFALPQNWKDQTVLSLGGAWKANEQLTLRAGVNLADNPIPDATVNPLFPATVKNHFTFGLGYQSSPTGELNASLTIAPSTSVTSGGGVAISHGQTNLQFMYSHRF